MSLPVKEHSADERPGCLPTDGGQCSAATLGLLIEGITDHAIYMLDEQGNVTTWNAGAARLTGYGPDEVLGKNFSMFFLPSAAEAGDSAQQLATAAREGRFEMETLGLRKGDKPFWALVTLTAIRGSDGELLGFADVTRDISAQRALNEAYAKLARDFDQHVKERTRLLEASVEELRAKNEEIEALVAMVSHDLSEKEVLLREVYHRVKNNLQVVQSLLKMGARTVRSNDAREAIETAVRRVHVMAMVHEHLYQMPDLAGLTLSAFLRDVVEGAIASNSERSERIQLQLDIEEIPVRMDFAIPLGLLANELVSNCLKHGIPHGSPGRVSISARAFPGGVRFIVGDDGIGLPENFDAQKGTSMGLKLAASLAHQLGGRLQFTSNKGCRVQADLTQLNSQFETLQPSADAERSAPLPWTKEPSRETSVPKRVARAAPAPSCYLS